MVTRLQATRVDVQPAVRGHGVDVCSLLIACALTACFDVEQRDPVQDGTILSWPSVKQIDDFEDGNVFPDLPALEAWTPVSWFDDTMASAAEAEGFGGGLGRSLSFVLRGVDTGAALVSWVENQRFLLDFSQFDQLSFRAKLEPAEQGSFDAAERLPVRVRLTCVSAAEQPFRDGDPQGEAVGVEIEVSPGEQWQSFELELSKLQQPTWQDWPGAHIDHDDCLRQIDAVSFEVAPTLRDGQSVAGTLTLDDIRLVASAPSAETFHEQAALSAWACETATANPDAEKNPHCEVVSNLTGAAGPSMRFEIDDPTDRNFALAALCAAPVALPLDLGAFESLTVSAKAETDEGLPRGAFFSVDLECSSILGAAHAPLVQAEFTPTKSTEPFVLPLSEFHQTGGVPSAAFDERACLGQMDKLCVTVQLEDEGGSVSGELSVERVVLR